MCHSLITVFWAPRCPEPLSKNEAECQTNFNHHAIKTLFSTRKFLHVASFWNWGCLELGDMSLLPRAYIIIWHNLPEISSPIAKLFGSFGSLKSDFQWISTHKLNEVCIIQVIIQETGLHFFHSYSFFFRYWTVLFVAIQTRIPGTISSLNLCLKYLTIIEKLYQANFLKIHLF